MTDSLSRPHYNWGATFHSICGWLRRHPESYELFLSSAISIILYSWSEQQFAGDDRLPARITSFLGWVVTIAGGVASLFLLSYLRHSRSYRYPAKNIKATQKSLELLVQRISDALGDSATPAMQKFLIKLKDLYSSPGLSEKERIAKHIFCDKYIDTEYHDISDHSIQTTTDIYTELLWHLTRSILAPRGVAISWDDPKRATPPSLTRLHITGMLPEEFYNGPQLVYEQDVTSMPRIVGHCWEDYAYMYPGDLAKRKRLPFPLELDYWAPELRVQRYVVVRSDDSPSTLVGAMSTRKDLVEQSTLCINNNFREFTQLKREDEAVIHRLLRKMPHAAKLGGNQVRELASRFLEQNLLRYCPVVEEPLRDMCSKASAGLVWKPLIDVFAREYHTRHSDCRYGIIDADVWTRIRKKNHLQRCFVSGHAPEIVLFGDGPGQTWYFGLEGLYRPFTREIKLRFLNQEEATTLAEEFFDAMRGAEGELPLQD